MAALGRMASGIAHEIRNPLEIIYMGVDYLENNISSADPQITESVEKIYKAANRADNIIKNILSFSRKSECKITKIPICQLPGQYAVPGAAGHQEGKGCRQMRV